MVTPIRNRVHIACTRPHTDVFGLAAQARVWLLTGLVDLGRLLSAQCRSRNRSLSAKGLSLLAPRGRGAPRNERAKDSILWARCAQLVDFGTARRAASRVFALRVIRNRERPTESSR